MYPAAASAICGLVLSCFGAILVHSFTLGLGDMTTVQTSLGAIVGIATQRSEVHTGLTFLQWRVWWHPPTTGTLLGIPRRQAGTSPAGSNLGKISFVSWSIMVNFIALGCPVQEISQQTTGRLLALTPKVVTRVPVHDLWYVNPSCWPNVSFVWDPSGKVSILPDADATARVLLTLLFLESLTSEKSSETEVSDAWDPRAWAWVPRARDTGAL